MNVHPFSDLEGLRVAAEMERRGGHFYARTARILRDPEVVSLLTRLAEEEASHLAEFQKLYQDALGAGDDPLYDDETNAYLSAVAAEVVFPDGLTELVCDPTPEGVLRAAIRAEEDSIAFYEKMLENTRSKSARQSFSAIADTEREHRSGLKAMLDQRIQEVQG